jgi:phosphatidylglycerol---prolipoprotein diacylglyceryl transferase
MLIHLSELDPIAISIGPLAIRWYSLAYIGGILFTIFWLNKTNKKDPLLSKVALDEWLTWAIISILLGGRLGYVLFYNWSYYSSNLLEIFAFWKGGMSFHGGLLGAIIGMWIFAKRYKIDYLKLTDRLSVAAPIGLFLGRIANFINMELYGRATNGNYGVIFPNAGDFPRHPSQLYEAFCEGLLLFIILFGLQHFLKSAKNRGFLSGLFLIGYSGFRILLENFREPDSQIGFIFEKITLGQLLSTPLFFLGIFLFLRSITKKIS